MDVLLIEDDEPFAFSLTEYLEDREYHLTTVREGFKGLEEARKGYGCILLDLGLPDVDGIQLLPKLTEAAARSPIDAESKPSSSRAFSKPAICSSKRFPAAAKFW